jgi:hypothetical protein
VRNAAKFSDAIFSSPADRPAEWEILLVLAALCSGAPLAEVDAARLDDFFFFGLVATLAATHGAHRRTGSDGDRRRDARARAGAPARLRAARRAARRAYGAVRRPSLARLREHRTASTSARCHPPARAPRNANKMVDWRCPHHRRRRPSTRAPGASERGLLLVSRRHLGRTAPGVTTRRGR